MALLERLGLTVTLPGLARRILSAIPEQERQRWQFDEAGVCLSDGEGSVLHLDNMFAEYRSAARSQRAALVNKYAEVLTGISREVPALWVAAKRHVYPVVRWRFVDTWPEIGSRSSNTGYPRLVFPFAGDLDVRLMYDFGSFMTYVKPEHVATWGQSQDDVMAHAVANLARLETPTWLRDPRGFHEIESPDSFGESMLLLDATVGALPFPDWAVFMPCNRGRLLACDARDHSAWRAMLEEATHSAQQAPWPMSGYAVRRGEAGWEVAHPPADLQRLSENLLRLREAEIYATQAEALDLHFQATGTDLFVAAFTLVEAQGGALWSYCVWTRDVDSLLPVADSVVFVSDPESDEYFRVAWADAARICGSLLLETGESPPRFRASSFPSSEQLDDLRKLAL